MSPFPELFSPHFGNLLWWTEVALNSSLGRRIEMQNSWQRAREASGRSTREGPVLQVCVFGGSKAKDCVGSLQRCFRYCKTEFGSCFFSSRAVHSSDAWDRCCRIDPCFLLRICGAWVSQCPSWIEVRQFFICFQWWAGHVSHFVIQLHESPQTQEIMMW